MSLTLRTQKPTSNRAPRRFHLTAEQRETEEQYRYYRNAPKIIFDHQQKGSSKQSSSKQGSSKQTKNSFALLSESTNMPQRHEEYPSLGTNTKKPRLQGAWAKKSTVMEIPKEIAEPPKTPEKQKKQKKTNKKGLDAALKVAEKLVETIEEWELE